MSEPASLGGMSHSPSKFAERSLLSNSDAACAVRASDRPVEAAALRLSSAARRTGSRLCAFRRRKRVFGHVDAIDLDDQQVEMVEPGLHPFLHARHSFLRAADSAAIGSRKGGERRRSARKLFQGIPSFSKLFANFSKLFASFLQGFPSFFLGGFKGNQGLAVEGARIRFSLSLPPLPPEISRPAAATNLPLAGALNAPRIVDSTDLGFQKENVGGGGESVDS